ncbi:MAG: C40 family peptidase [Treponema sp.]|jgi:probable lipoprotein NlpC|nr:C40 family peptidase [Treponema sp.]
MRKTVLFIIISGLFLQGGLFAAPLDRNTPEEAAAARLKVLAAAEKYHGTRYRYGGIDGQGFDCSGFVYRSFKDALSVSVPRTTGGLYNWAEKISDGELQAGDLLFFKTGAAGTISHVGIYTGNNRFIHAASAGPKTGVIYSELNEAYWRRTYAGAGRALPPEAGVTAAVPAAGPDPAAVPAGSAPAAGVVIPGTARPGAKIPDNDGEKDEPELGIYRMGLGFAPSWNGFLKDHFPIRGGAGFIRVAAETHTWKKPVLLALELRPEWDNALGVFRLPITLSAGFDERIRIFLGPSLSFGDAVLKTADGERRYKGGTSWMGTAGIAAAPFSWKVKNGVLALYGEFAWQSYFSDSPGRNMNADICAGLRFSTGLSFTWNLFPDK